MTEDGQAGPTEESASALSEFLTGVLVAAVGVSMWLFTASLSPMIPGTLVGPALLPRICATGFVTLGGCLCVAAWRHGLVGRRKMSEAGPMLIQRAIDPAFLVPLLLVAIWLLAPVVGLLATTAAAGLLLMRARGGGWLVSLACSTVLIIAVHVLFTEVMRIQMPQGFLM